MRKKIIRKKRDEGLGKKTLIREKQTLVTEREKKNGKWIERERKKIER